MSCYLWLVERPFGATVLGADEAKRKRLVNLLLRKWTTGLKLSLTSLLLSMNMGAISRNCPGPKLGFIILRCLR